MENKFYKEIDKAIHDYEICRPVKAKTISWICDRIDWCHHWKKISEQETAELVNRIVKVMEEV